MDCFCDCYDQDCLTEKTPLCKSQNFLLRRAFGKKLMQPPSVLNPENILTRISSFSAAAVLQYVSCGDQEISSTFVGLWKLLKTKDLILSVQGKVCAARAGDSGDDVVVVA